MSVNVIMGHHVGINDVHNKGNEFTQIDKNEKEN